MHKESEFPKPKGDPTVQGNAKGLSELLSEPVGVSLRAQGGEGGR